MLEKSSISRDGVESGLPFLIRGTVAGYKFVRPIPAKLTYIIKQDAWLISDDNFEEYGVGKTIREARRDYISGLISYYEVLAMWATDENPPTQHQFRQLREYFVED